MNVGLWVTSSTLLIHNQIRKQMRLLKMIHVAICAEQMYPHLKKTPAYCIQLFYLKHTASKYHSDIINMKFLYSGEQEASKGTPNFWETYSTSASCPPFHQSPPLWPAFSIWGHHWELNIHFEILVINLEGSFKMSCHWTITLRAQALLSLLLLRLNQHSEFYFTSGISVGRRTQHRMHLIPQTSVFRATKKQQVK